jgi:hypothetical protein
MAQVTEHHSEQQWEGNYSKDSWIDFFMHRDTIGVDNFLENNRKIISFNIGWRLNAMIFKSLKVGRTVSREARSNLLLSYVGSFPLLHQVNTVVDSLFFGNKPFVDFKAASTLLGSAISAWDLINLN